MPLPLARPRAARRGEARAQPSDPEVLDPSAHAVRGRHCMVVYATYPLGETRVQREADALVEAGYGVHVICLRDPGEAAHGEHSGVVIHRLPVRLDKRSLLRQLLSYVHFFVLASLRLTRLHLQQRFGTVQVHNLPDFLVFCALVPKLTGATVLLDLHDLMPEFFAGRFGPAQRPLLAAAVRVQERAACRFADHVITVSEHWRQALIGRGVRTDKCSVVMNLADERIFVRRPGQDPDPTTFRLIYHGTITHRYGLDLALRAVAQLAPELPDIRLTVLGTGDGVEELQALHRALELDGFVEVRNELVLAEELPALLTGAYVGIVPYRNDVFTDGLLPTKLMEYAALGMPCIAARTTAIERYFSDTLVAFFEPDDVADLARCIRWLHDEPEALARLAAGAETFNRRHSWRRASAAYVSLVEGAGRRSRNAELAGFQG